MTFEEDHVSQRYRSHRALLPGSWSVEVKLRGREGMGHPWFAPRVNQKEPLPDPESWDAPPPELFINTVSPEGWQRPASQALWDGDLLKVQFYPIISQASWVTKDIEASKGSGGCYWRSCLIGFLLPEDFWGKERTQS